MAHRVDSALPSVQRHPNERSRFIPTQGDAAQHQTFGLWAHDHKKTNRSQRQGRRHAYR